MAIYLLEGDANRWWEEMETRTTPKEIQEIDWEEFRELFLRRYFPHTERTRMETLFLEMKQKEDESLAEYES